MTPSRDELPPKPLKDEENYDIGDLRSDEVHNRNVIKQHLPIQFRLLWHLFRLTLSYLSSIGSFSYTQWALLNGIALGQTDHNVNINQKHLSVAGSNNWIVLIKLPV